jgi:predicted permease
MTLDRFVQIIRLRIRSLFFRARLERDLDDELQYHIESKAAELMQQGWSSTEALTEARRGIGGIEQRKEECRDQRGLGWLEEFVQDLRYALRMLRKNPVFSIVAALTMALAIGANTAIFTVVNGVILKSLPFPEPNRLLVVSGTSKTSSSVAVSYPDYLDWRSGQSVFSGMAARLQTGGVFTGSREPRRVFGRLVTASFFSTLQISPQAGRFFTEAEDRPGSNHVLLISDRLWRQYFDADSSIIGNAVHYNGEPWTVIGVMPRAFDFYGRDNENNDVFLPLGATTDKSYMQNRGSRLLRVTARLKPNITERQALTAMQGLASRLEQQYPATNSGTGITLRPMLTDYVGEARRPLGLLSAGVIFVLLIACANVANLTLARSVARRKEIGLRLALGASRSRVIRLLLTESVLLSVAGGAFGIGLAIWGVENLKAYGADIIPRLTEIEPDPRILAVMTLVTIASGVAFGLVPALQSTRIDLDSALKTGGRQSSGDVVTHRVRSLLVVTELALSLMLLISAGLLVHSFRNLMHVSLGYDARNVLTFRLRLPDAKYPDAAHAVGFLRQAREKCQQVPGVKTVSIASGFPLGRSSENTYTIEGEPGFNNTNDWPVAASVAVDEHYHEALGIPLLVGRLFTEQDTAAVTPVVVVDEEWVRRQFGGKPLTEVLGRRLRYHGEHEPWRQIVGVVPHVKHDGLEAGDRPQIYQPWTQITGKWSIEYLRAMDFVIKTSTNPLGIIPSIRREILSLDKDQPVGEAKTLEALLAESLAARQFNLVLITIFSISALLLSAIGLCGVLSYMVGQRRREIGLRSALGAQRIDIITLVVGEGMRLAAVGALAGTVGALLISRLMTSLLYGITANDPATYGTVLLLVMAVALLACYLPANRASKVQPMEALRRD